MDDDEPRPRAQLVGQPVLDMLGISELRDYIAALQSEIARAEGVIARKSGHMGVAEALFGRK